MHSDATIYDDADADQIETIAPTQIHRDVDLLITAADTEGMYSIVDSQLTAHKYYDSAPGYIKSYIIVPTSVWGLATGRLVDSGVQNPHSMLIPVLVKAALDRGRAGMVGEGKNIWHNVEIHECGLSNLCCPQHLFN